MRPENFVSLSEFCPRLLIEASYATTKNFTGSVVDGYKRVDALMSRAGAEALCAAQSELDREGLRLKIFDAYRPKKAVAFFQHWAKLPGDDVALKAHYYPTHTKLELFEIGYIAKQSSHSRGSAVDLTLVDATGAELDMGTVFDFFHEKSHTRSPLITPAQRANREKLVELMQRHGFKNYLQEWWHFSLVKEAFPGQSFDFDVD